MRKSAKNLLVTGKLFCVKPPPSRMEAKEAHQAALAARARAAHFLAQARMRFEEAERMVEKTEDVLFAVTGPVN